MRSGIANGVFGCSTHISRSFGEENRSVTAFTYILTYLTYLLYLLTYLLTYLTYLFT